MTKTTFLGYVPSLKSKHEATIVNGRAMKSKGGSIRYLLEGEYDGRKTLPKTVSKEDFVKVYGFDAKEAESVVILGKNEDSDEGVMLGHAVGKEDKTGFTPTKIATGGSVALIEQTDNHQAETVVGSPSPADVEPPAPSEKPFPQEPSNENFSADGASLQTYFIEQEITWKTPEDIRDTIVDLGLEGNVEADLILNDDKALNEFADALKEYNETEVKEALGLFGKKEEEEKEPKTQEFTVVLQEGDKLELTDIEEEDEAPDDKNTEKEAESPKTRTFVVSSVDYETDDEDQDELGLPQDFTFVLDIDGPFGIGDTTDMQEIADEIVDDISDETGFLVSGFYFQEKMPDGTLVDLDAETYEAVQAKVTRPVKEEEKEESDEGLSTGAKVALGVGALAAGVALFGAEEDDYVPYESETDYSRIYEATSGEGYINHDPIYQDEDRRVEIKYDDPTTYYDWTSQDEVDEDEVEEAIKEELGNEPGTGAYGATLEVRSALNPDKYVDVDVDMDTDYNEGRFMGMAAEHESESDGYTYAYTKGHKDGMDNEVVYRPSIETDREKTVFKKILKQKAESFDNDFSHVKTYDDYRKEFNRIKKEFGYDGEFMRFKIDQLHDYCSRNVKDMMADTVGSPSPSGPSSTPEPAEATGSEPSNENMEAEGSNMKLALGILGVGVGAVALLGGDRIKKIFDRFNL